MSINHLIKKAQVTSLNGGQAMILATIFFLVVTLSLIFGISGPILKHQKITSQHVFSNQSYFLAEAGLEDVLFRLRTGKPVGASQTLNLNGSVATIVTTDLYNGKEIVATGDVSDVVRKVKASVVSGVGVVFGYGVQVGAGGISMGNNSIVNGSVYSNGPITGAGNITGTAFSANSAALTVDQTNGSGIPSYNVTFGDSNSTQDFAQSFQVGTTGSVNKVDLYLKKVSTPANLTVRIVSNAGSSPSASTLAVGSLSASLVSINYGWVSVPLSTNPELLAGTTYWIVIDGSTSSSKYYVLGANSNGYVNGVGKIGQYAGTWNNTSPSGLDAFFKLYLGDVTGIISGINIGTGSVGNAYAHTVNNSTIAGTNYCQTGSGNNKTCNTSLADPSQVAMPISDQNILDWKAEAEVGGIISGNYTLSGSGSTDSLGPKKITGNLIVDNNADLTVTGTIWVLGNVLVDNNATVRLSPGYDTSEGVLVADGIIMIRNNAIFAGSGSTGSYLLTLSTSNSTDAISLQNNGGSVILYAANGTVSLSNNASAKSLNGKFISLGSNAEIIYDTGLANANFVNGPSGGWDISSWLEVE